MSPTRCAQLLALLFAASAAFAIIHRATGGEYLGFTHVHDVVIDVGLAVVWLTAAAAALLQRGWPALFATIVGAAVTIMHGVMFSIATSDRGPRGVGVPFLLGAAVELYLVVRAAPAFLAERPEREPVHHLRLEWLVRLRHVHRPA